MRFQRDPVGSSISSASGDDASVSSQAKLFSELEELSKSNPTEFKKITAEILKELTAAAKSASDPGFALLDPIQAHRHSIRHFDEIIASGVCGCFYCLAIFQPNDIRDWVDRGELPPAGVTALCPRCGIDSVIGSASGYPITQPFLTEMQSLWFNTPQR